MDLTLASHAPPPRFCFHHLTLSLCRVPPSISLRMAWSSSGLNGVPGLVAIPYPLLSSSPPTCNGFFRSFTYCIGAKNLRS